jgi:GGDEF domain-containing protein
MSEPDPSLAALTLSQAPFGVMLIQGPRIAWANETLAQALMTTAAAITGLEVEAARRNGLSVLFDDKSPEIEVKLPDGSVRRWQRLRQALPAGAEAHFFIDVTRQFELVEELRQTQEQLKVLDTRDGETGLMSSNAILQALDAQITRSRRYGNPLSAIRLNLTPPASQTPQHTALRTISQEFKMQLRWADQIGRLDDDNFLLVLPETPLKDAESLAQKLGHDRIALTSRAEGWSITFTCAEWRKGDDTRKLLKRLQEAATATDS